MGDERWRHQIGGRLTPGFLPALLAGAVIGTLGALLYRGGNGGGVIILLFGAALLAGALARTVIYLLCFRLRVEADGFYLRKFWGKGTYYPYRDIQSCRTEERKRMIPARSGGGEFRQFCFVFQDRAGAVRRFVYDPAQWDREIRALKERIRAAGAETERDT